MKKVVKKHYKIVIGIIVGLIVSTMGTYAAEQVLTSDEVLYTNSTSGNKTVQAALDDLYKKTNSCKEYIPNDNPNRNIVKAYKYDENSESPTYCINGEEGTCFATSCYENKAKGVCPVGTIIEYKVNNNSENNIIRFHVIHDDGEKMTLQSQKNIVHNVAFYITGNEIYENGNCTNCDNKTNGPETILTSIEEKTKEWENVNEIEYTAGQTIFYKNAFTGCSFNSGTEGDYTINCGINIYTLETRKARARIITALEASSTGCLVNKDGNKDKRILGKSINANNDGSCPDFMHNYLRNSKSYGGSYEDSELKDDNYWTSSGCSYRADSAWFISTRGIIGESPKFNTGIGARAVVEINK